MKYLKRYNESNSKFEGYTAREIAEGVLSGKLKINDGGHNLTTFGGDQKKVDDHVKEYFEDIIRNIDDEIKHFQNNPKMSDYINRMNTWKIEPHHWSIGSTIGEYYCWDCGERLKPYVVDEHNIALVVPYRLYDLRKNRDEGVPPNLAVKDCKLKGMIENETIVTHIEVPTGELVFTNFFKKDEIYSPKGTDSINAIGGRIELARALEKENVGYGQMGNMSVDVYKKKDGTEVIIGTDYAYQDGGEVHYEFEGFDHIGNISLSVWRWMCADKAILAKHNEELPKNLKMDGATEMDYRDYVLCGVKPGKWRIEHYYDIQGDRKDGIYSKLTLVK